MFKLLKQPYPLREIKNKDVLPCLLTGLFVFLFLLFFQPFGLFNWNSEYKIISLFGFGLVTFLIMMFNSFFIKKPGEKTLFIEDKWTVGKEMIWNFYMLTSISLGNCIYITFLEKDGFSLLRLFEITFATFTIGIFPTVAFIIGNYIIQLKKYQAPIYFQPLSNPVKNIENTIQLLAENEKDSINITTNELLYIESSDNYSTVFVEKEGKIKKEIIRSSLSRLESQIGNSEIIRCHRSYIVNLPKVKSVTGNAQGYKLHLENIENPIPVSRKYTNIVKSELMKA